MFCCTAGPSAPDKLRADKSETAKIASEELALSGPDCFRVRIEVSLALNVVLMARADGLSIGFAHAGRSERNREMAIQIAVERPRLKDRGMLALL